MSAGEDNELRADAEPTTDERADSEPTDDSKPNATFNVCFEDSEEGQRVTLDVCFEDLEEWRRFKAMAVKGQSERFRWRYARTQNPVHALNAYRFHRHTKHEVPDWILELFDQWAEVLCVEGLKGGKEIAHALGLGSKGGGPSITSQAETQTRDMLIAERVLNLRSSHPERNKLDIFHEVAEEFELSSERVANIFSELTRGIKS